MKITGTPAENEFMRPLLELYISYDGKGAIATCSECKLIFISRENKTVCDFCNGEADRRQEVNRRRSRERSRERKKAKPFQPQEHAFYSMKKRAGAA